VNRNLLFVDQTINNPSEFKILSLTDADTISYSGPQRQDSSSFTVYLPSGRRFLRKGPAQTRSDPLTWHSLMPERFFKAL